MIRSLLSRIRLEISVPKVTVFVQPPGIPCGQCHMTKKVMDMEGIPFDERVFTEDLISDFKAGIEVQGQIVQLMSAPVVIIGDLENPDAAWAGFQPQKIKDIPHGYHV